MSGGFKRPGRCDIAVADFIAAGGPDIMGMKMRMIPQAALDIYQIVNTALEQHWSRSAGTQPCSA